MRSLVKVIIAIIISIVTVYCLVVLTKSHHFFYGVYHLNRAERLIDEGSYVEGDIFNKKSINDFESFWGGRSYLAYCYKLYLSRHCNYRDENFDLLKKYLTRLINISPDGSKDDIWGRINLGILYVIHNHYDKGIQELQTVLPMVQKKGDAPSEGMIYFGLGFGSLGHQNLEQAKAFFLLAKEKYEGDPEQIGKLAEVNAALAVVCFNLGEEEEAVAHCENAIQVDKRNNHLVHTNRYFLRVLAEGYIDIEKAEPILLKALEYARMDTESNPDLEALIHKQLAAFYAGDGKLAQAQEHFLAAIEHASGIKGASELTGRLAYEYAVFLDDYMNNPELAEEHLYRAIDNTQEGSELAADAWASLGIIYRKRMMIEDAIVAYENALIIYDILDIPMGKARVLNNLGYCCFIEGNNHQAISYGKRALKILNEQREDDILCCAVYDTLGCGYLEIGDYDRAEECFINAINIGRRRGVSPRRLGGYYEKMGDLYDISRDMRKAMCMWKQACHWYGKAGDHDRALDLQQRINQRQSRLQNS